MKRDREGVEGKRGGGHSHALCEKGVVRSCRGGGKREREGGGGSRGIGVTVRSDCAGCFLATPRWKCERLH